MSSRAVLTIATIFVTCLPACSNELSEEELNQAFEEMRIEQEACRARMVSSAKSSQNYIAQVNYSDAQRNSIIENHNAQSKAYLVCAMELDRKHAEAVFEACEKEGCGENILGGCFHIAEYSVYTSVTDAARMECTHNKSFKKQPTAAGTP